MWCAERRIRWRWPEKLIDDLDKAKPEVIVEVAMMQVSRDKAHTLGINPPTSATVALQNNINTTYYHQHTSTTGTSSINTTTGRPTRST